MVASAKSSSPAPPVTKTRSTSVWEVRALLLHDESPAGVELRESSYVLGTYARTPFHPREGKGARLADAEGKIYWDLLSGIAVNALGYRHPAILRALREASEGLLHVSNLFFHPWQGILAERLVAGSGLARAFFCNSGTEANEAALKFARLRNPGRSKVVAIEESFHGRTFGSLSLTGHEAYRTPFAPLVSGDVVFVPPNDTEALEKAVDGETSAIFLEPIMGEGGIIPLSSKFMQTASVLADRHGALLVCDEIQCGLGRTGKLFAFEHAGIVPDMVTLAKPLGGGLPLGAVLVGPRVEDLVKPGHHGTTFGGNPVACRLGVALLAAIEEERLLAKIEALGAWLESELAPLAGKHGILDVRGMGLMWGIELDRPATPVMKALLAEGFVVGTARDKVIRLLPPYIVPKKALQEFVKALVKALENTSSSNS
ncbi:MAG: acetylornithine/succinylornithine family transaminase [Acidobacteria bacterium]|nr:acetylornithine/succinylornithine family transaminase [Acidobacteriota bacterium]